MTFEWLKFSWYKVQDEKRHRHLNELGVYREWVVPASVGNQFIWFVHSGLQNFSHNFQEVGVYLIIYPK